MGIEGFDEDIATELKARAQAFIEEENQKVVTKLNDLGVAEDLLTAGIDGLDMEMMVTLGEGGVKTRDDLADLASDELIEILGVGSMSMEEANTMIMAARAHWFEDEDSETSDADSSDDESAEDVE